MLRHARIWSCLIVAVVCVSHAEAQTGPTGPKRKVHVIVAGLTSDPNIGRSVEYNINQVKKLLESGLADHHRGEVIVIKDARTNARDILETVDRLSPGPNDAIFMYYHGHGAYDASFAFRDPSGGHYFDIPSGDLMRKDLWDHMKARKAKLTVLVTETCYVPAPAHPFRAEKPSTTRSGKDLPVLTALLLSQDGFIDINACAKNEFSWNFAPGSGGSFFTDSFVNTVYDAPFTNPSKVTWSQFMNTVSRKASGIYKKLRTDLLSRSGVDAGLADMLRRQADQRAAIIQTSFSGTGGVDPLPPITGEVRAVGAGGLTISDRLDASDAKDLIRRDSFHKRYKVRLEAGSLYVIDLKSRDIDSFLRLENDRGEQLLYDDDSGGDLNAQLKFRPAAAGVYTIIATTYHEGSTGAFTLTVSKEGGPVPVGAALAVGPGGLNIAVKLTEGDPRDRVRRDSHFKVYEVRMEAGKTYQIDLESGALDPYLRLENAVGTQLAANDDFGGTLNSRIEFRPTATGVYRIVCTTFRPGTGDMTLRVVER
jgi:hypothetical protein